jgi:hypothetical protein
MRELGTFAVGRQLQQRLWFQKSSIGSGEPPRGRLPHYQSPQYVSNIVCNCRIPNDNYPVLLCHLNI